MNGAISESPWAIFFLFCTYVWWVNLPVTHLELHFMMLLHTITLNMFLSLGRIIVVCNLSLETWYWKCCAVRPNKFFWRRHQCIWLIYDNNIQKLSYWLDVIADWWICDITNFTNIRRNMTFILPSPFNTSSALDISLITHLFSKLQGVFSRVIVANKMAAAREKSGEYTWCQLIWRATLFILTVAFYIINIFLTTISNEPSISE